MDLVLCLGHSSEKDTVPAILSQSYHSITCPSPRTLATSQLTSCRKELKLCDLGQVPNLSGQNLLIKVFGHVGPLKSVIFLVPINLVCVTSALPACIFFSTCDVGPCDTQERQGPRWPLARAGRALMHWLSPGWPL